MSDTLSPPIDASIDRTCSPLDDPNNIILGESCGTVFLTPKHLDVVMQMPLPGIVIFVHGVNSDGEWFAQAEEGLCNGLNDRLKRRKEHMAYPTPEGGQLTPVQYLADLTTDGFVNPEKKPDNFIATDGHFSPVIHFRWGYKASAADLQTYGNAIFLNEKNYWGGGPFANGCTALPDLWADGLSHELFLWLHVQHMNPTNDRKVYACPPRPYYVLAALRLAKLVETIRSKQADAPITIVCHSQGNMIGIAAAFLGDRLAPASDPTGKTGRCVADSYVLCNAPYSLVAENVAQGLTERGLKDEEGNGGRQTWEARIATLREFFNIVGKQADTEQPDAVIKEALDNKAHDFDAALDRREFGYGPKKSTLGRVTLYFNPHDQVISATTIQGIGWRGLSKHEIDAVNGAGIFCQRVFSQNYTVGQKGSYDFWADQHNKPKPDTHAFWYPPSPVARYSLAKGLKSNADYVAKFFTIVSAPLMYGITSVTNIRINALPPKVWETPLDAPNLHEKFVPKAVRFGHASEQFDQGMDAPGEYRAQGRTRDAADPYAGDRKVPHTATDEAKRKGTDAAEGNAETEAALLYEHHAMLRMEAKREKLYANEAPVTAEDNPATAKAEYTAWRNEKIRESLLENIDTHATDHSTIMTNAMHAQKALAYDVAVGVCRIRGEDFRMFRQIADWRLLEDLKLNNPHAVFFEYFADGVFKGSDVSTWAKAAGSEGSMPLKIANRREIFSKKSGDKP
jgi:pimeloyl-ACP methyl ester carboxylesterase